MSYEALWSLVNWMATGHPTSTASSSSRAATELPYDLVSGRSYRVAAYPAPLAAAAPIVDGETMVRGAVTSYEVAARVVATAPKITTTTTAAACRAAAGASTVSC
jgi:hypothetical protein